MSQRHYVCYFSIIIIFMCVLFVSGSFPEDVLQTSLFEVGTLWTQAAKAQMSRLVSFFSSVSCIYSPYLFLKLAAVAMVIYVYYVVQIRPLNRVRKLDEVGYIPERGYSIKETANLVQKRRRVGNTPVAYPNGWFGLLESMYLKTGEAKSISALGQNYAVFRDEAGVAHVVDAYCPHMGANLAVGGRVIGDCLECPFHAWRFRGEDGKCVHIPYSEKIPDIARVHRYPSCERSGWLFVWYHAEGLGPNWDIPVVEELENKSWVYRGRTEHFVNAHIEEIAENGADVVHLKQVHGPIITAGTDLRTMWHKWWGFAGHNWTAAWEQSPDPDGHIGCMKLTHEMSIFGFLFPMFSLSLVARQIGPGLVYLKFDSFCGRGMFLLTVTPQGPLLQRMVHRIYTSSWMPAIVAKIYMISEAIQVERDIMIWNNKQYEAKPLFIKSKEDSLISKHRRWFSQFYSKKASSIFQKEDLSF